MFPPLALLQYLRQYGNAYRQLIRIQPYIGGSGEDRRHFFHFCTKIEIDRPLELTEVDDVGPNLYSSGALIVSSTLLIIANIRKHATNKLHEQYSSRFIEYYIQLFEMAIHVIPFLQ